MIITDETLKARPLSYSSLKQFAKTPEHYIEYLSAPRSESPAMRIGKVMHCLLLEPEEFIKRYIVMPPDIDRRTKAGKEAYQEFLEEAEGKTLLTNGEHENAICMKRAIEKNSASSEYIKEITETEKKISWTHKESNLPLVGYLDGVCENMIIDIKSSNNASPEDFFKDAYRFGYHIQAANYIHGMMRKGKGVMDYYFIVVEPSAPYGVSVFKADGNYINYGFDELDRLCKSFRMWMDEGCPLASYEYHSPINGYHQLYIPSWATNK